MSNHDVKEIYVDGIGSITFIGGMVRADLVRYSLTEKNKQGNPALQSCAQLIMSPQGLLQAANEMNTLIKKMVDKGVLKPAEKKESSTKN